MTTAPPPDPRRGLPCTPPPSASAPRPPTTLAHGPPSPTSPVLSTQGTSTATIESSKPASRSSILPTASQSSSHLPTPPFSPLKPTDPVPIEALSIPPTNSSLSDSPLLRAPFPTLPDEPTTFAGALTLGTVLGEGQWSVVRSASAPAASTDASQPRVYAIKTPRSSLSPNSAARRILHKEAVLLSFLCRSPDAATHIVPFYGIEPSSSSLVLGYAPQTLETWIRAWPRPDYPDEKPLLGTIFFLRLARDLVASLSWLHDRDVVHGDLKPGNVLLMSVEGTQPGDAKHMVQPRIADFSSSIYLPSPHTASPLDAFTVQYASPEFLQRYRQPGGGIPDKQFDAWGMAATLLFAGTGEQPYASASNSFGRLMEAKKGRIIEGVRTGMNLRKVKPEGWLMRTLGGILDREEGRRWTTSQWQGEIDTLLGKAVAERKDM